MAEATKNQLKVNAKAHKTSAKRLYEELMAFNVNKDLDQLKW